MATRILSIRADRSSLRLPKTKDELLIAEFDLDKIDEVRSVWQFYRDRRPETYGKLTEL